jgi:hypothetical protein
MTASRIASLAFLAFAAPCFSQGRVDAFLGVKNWHGNITITGTGSGSTSGGIYSDIWQFGLTSKVSFQLDALQGGAWTQALSLTVTDQNGTAQKWPMQFIQASSPALSLSGINSAEADWLVAPSDTTNLAAGVYNVSATLDTTSSAASGTFTGSIGSNTAAVTLNVEPGSLLAEDEASKYLAFAACARLRGDTQGVGAALDTLIAHQPAILEAVVEKGDLLAAVGDYAGALALYQQATAKFVAANPTAAEPLTLFTQKMDAMTAKIASQNVVTNVAPGARNWCSRPIRSYPPMVPGLPTRRHRRRVLSWRLSAEPRSPSRIPKECPRLHRCSMSLQRR